MHIGLFGINTGACANPATAAAVAKAAEAAGFESLWTGEHVVLPDPRQAPSPAAPETPMLHPPALLAFLAGQTRTIKLATGITLVAQRNPVVLAKEIGSLDVLCGGRLLFGIGAGYLHQEFDALGVDFATRGARTDEYIDAMRELWRAPKPAFNGRFVHFGGINAQPRPVQAGGPPVIVGGTSPGALKRVVQRGQGWYGFALDVATSGKVIGELKRHLLDTSRDPALGELTFSVTPPVLPSKAMVEDYAALGVSRLIPMLRNNSETTALEVVAKLATDLF
ncbi:MAG: LLM class F420-dependent oxidoreductase [Gammaproteobacteria bacterium]|nr:LLM class F420-dependent oxidoreductase [Gammaproteobacteria bacterium]